ncbi:MAG: hypothetical protein JXA28_15350 [Bacteroidetes bacterium]|nr:hypothetical protein [Bacteroidota bacterium]
MFPRIDKGPIEYSLEIYPAFNTEKQRDCVRFHFRTTEEFTHFRYNIAIEELEEKGVLRFTLRGLKAKDLLPGTGVAESVVDLFDLAGAYDVRVTKPGDIVNSFRISFGDSSMRLVKSVTDADRFLDVAISNDKVENA